VRKPAVRAWLSPARLGLTRRLVGREGGDGGGLEGAGGRDGSSSRAWAVACAVAFLTSGLTAAAMLTGLKPSPVPGNIPVGAVVAFNGPCPPAPGWQPFKPAIARFVIGAGNPADSPFKKWKRHLSAGGFEEVDLTPRALSDYDGEESHILTVGELARHAHKTFRTKGEPGAGDGKYPSWKVMSNPGEALDVLTQEAGDNQPHNNMPPFLALTYCEKRE
jgi:hypothetical protein